MTKDLDYRPHSIQIWNLMHRDTIHTRSSHFQHGKRGRSQFAHHESANPMDYMEYVYTQPQQILMWKSPRARTTEQQGEADKGGLSGPPYPYRLTNKLHWSNIVLHAP